MNTKHMIYGIGLGVIVGLVLCYLAGMLGFISLGHHARAHESVGLHPTIAIVLPVSHPSLENIAQGFRDTLNRDPDIRPEFIEYNAGGNKVQLRTYIEDALSRNVDLIFAIATPPAQLAKELTAKKGMNTPIVFGAVTDPLSTGIIASIACSENNCTGIIDSVDHAKQFEALKILKPGIKNMLLVYDPSAAGIEQLRTHLEAIAQAEGITMQAAGVYRTSELVQQVVPHLKSVDAVLVLKDNTIVSGIESLIKLCEQYGVTLCVSDLDSVDKGAAFGFGVHEYDMGVASAHKAHQILVDKKLPRDIPSERAGTYRIKINRDHAPKQKLEIPPDMLLLMEYGEVVPECKF